MLVSHPNLSGEGGEKGDQDIEDICRAIGIAILHLNREKLLKPSMAQLCCCISQEVDLIYMKVQIE